MLSTPFSDPLPACLDANSDLGAFHEAAEIARERIKALEDQAIVLSLAQLFERHSSLKSFHFNIIPKNRLLPPNLIRLHANGERFSHVQWENAKESCPPNRPPMLYCSDTKRCVEIDPLLHAARGDLTQWIQRLLNDGRDLPRSWHRQVIERPASPELLFEGLLRQCLAPRAFAQWQAARLISSSHTPLAEAPARPSRSL